MVKRRLLLFLVCVVLLGACHSFVDEKVTEAEVALEADNIGKAIELYNEALKEDKNNAQIKSMLALLYTYQIADEKVTQGAYEEARDLTTEIMDTADESPVLLEKASTLLAEIEKTQIRLGEQAKKGRRAAELYERLSFEVTALTAEIKEESSTLDDNKPPAGFYGTYTKEWERLLDDVWSAIKEITPIKDYEKVEKDQAFWLKKMEEDAADIRAEDGATREMLADFIAKRTEARVVYLIAEHL